MSDHRFRWCLINSNKGGTLFPRPSPGQGLQGCMWTLFRIIYYISFRAGISWISAPISAPLRLHFRLHLLFVGRRQKMLSNACVLHGAVTKKSKKHRAIAPAALGGCGGLGQLWEALRRSERPWESLWEGLEELWESSGRLWHSTGTDWGRMSLGPGPGPRPWALRAWGRGPVFFLF